MILLRLGDHDQSSVSPAGRGRTTPDCLVATA
jgi:hypothetical protein